jgi:hypothetical protein
MKSVLRVTLALLILVSAVSAQASGTPDEAQAMVKKAIQFFKANGKDKAVSEFSNPKGKFISKDLYIFMYDMTGKCVAHGGNPKMIGKDLIDLKDSDGKPFVKERIEIIKSKGKGWQEYKFLNPTSKKIEDKTAYIEKCDEYVIGCGAYK